MPAVDFVIQPASTRTVGEVAAFLTEHGGAPWSLPGIDAGVSYPGQGFVALAESRIVGCVIGRELPSVTPGASVVFPLIVVATDRRRQGVGRRLVDALARAPRAASRSWAIVSCDEGSEIAEGFVRALGFEPIVEELHYERDLTLRGAGPDGRWTFVEYRGGDAAYDAAIARLYAWGFRGQFSMPALSPEGVTMYCASPASSYVLALDGERVVGYALLVVDGAVGWIDNVVVARSHWSKGVADAFCDELVTRVARKGGRTITSCAPRSNRAACRLNERCGAHVARVVRVFALPLGQGAGRPVA